jgi:hypothetical protein
MGDPETKGVPKPVPQRPIVANPSTPGVQTPNKPDGKDAPQHDVEKR